MQFTPKVKKAFYLASRIHKDQKRKLLDVPYITHLVGVAWSLSEFISDEDIICAAFLHDSVEDQNYTLEEISAEFNDRVMKIVADLTEDKKFTGYKKKEAYINHLKTVSDDALIVCVADKIDNMNSIVETFVNEGEIPWHQFTTPKEKMVEYYEKIFEIANKRLSNDIINYFASSLRSFLTVVEEDKRNV